MNIPKLIFYYALPFDAGRRKLFEDRGDVYPSRESVLQKVREYRAFWEKINANDQIMSRLVELLGIAPPRDLEVWVFGSGMNAMSSPFLVPAFRRTGESFSDDQLTEILIHESIHRFTSPQNNAGAEQYWTEIREKYAEESALTKNHILVYAALGIILPELFGADRAAGMVQPTSPDYKRAVAIAQEKGPQALVDQFRSFLG